MNLANNTFFINININIKILNQVFLPIRKSRVVNMLQAAVKSNFIVILHRFGWELLVVKVPYIRISRNGGIYVYFMPQWESKPK